MFSNVVSHKRYDELMIKRLIDVCFSVVLLIILVPVFVIIGLLVWMEDKGPIFFKQKRIGLNGDVFYVYKFRSMYKNKGDITGVQRTVKNDKRVTKVGNFIRKTSIDELPQLFNVLMGEMSLVGPRPHPLGMKVGDQGLYEELVPNYDKRHSLRPGITGLAQIHGYRGEVDTLRKAKGRLYWDIYYINNYSIGLDIYILYKTLFKGFVNVNAY